MDGAVGTAKVGYKTEGRMTWPGIQRGGAGFAGFPDDARLYPVGGLPARGGLAVPLGQETRPRKSLAGIEEAMEDGFLV